MLHHLAQLVKKIEEGDATRSDGSADAPSLSQDTLLSPDMRPDVLVTPDHVRAKRTVAAALFGTDPEPVNLGRYRLLGRLGAGGMGIVYAAYDGRLERKLALKLLRPSRLGNADAVARTLREARALARLSHPHVVHVYEVGELDGREIFVAMEHLDGPTLRAWLDAERRPWRAVLEVFRQAGEGLAAAHAHGIVHRDFKPHNAMFGGDGRVRVLDFGLAQIDGAADVREPVTAANFAERPGSLTSTGAVLGTPAYMAPEQLAGQKGDARSDQFSFCVALYEALYGKRPFAGETLGELADSVSSERVTPPPRSSDVPAWVREALLRGLRADPERRWPSMTALLAALSGDPAARRRRRQRWTAATMGLAVSLTGGAWWAGEHLRRADAEQRAALDREVVSARAEVDRQAVAKLLAQARGLLDRDPAGVIRTLAQLDAIAPADALEVRTLALAALARGLPDAALVGPEAELLGVATAADSGTIFAQDAAGDVWRWTADDRPGERIARLGQRAGTIVVAASGQAWAAALGDSLVGGHLQDGAWQTWRAASPEYGSPLADLMITADERWLVAQRGLPLVVLDLRTGQPVEDAFPELGGGDGDVRGLVSPDARFLARGRLGADAITIWDRTTGETRSAPALGALGELVGVVGDGRTLLGRSERDGATRLVAWDLARATAQEWRSDVLGATRLGGLVGLTSATDDGRVVCVAPPLAAACQWQHPIQQFDRLIADARHYALETPREQQPRRPLDLGDLATGAVVRRFLPGPARDGGQLDHAGRYLAARGPAIDVWQRRDPAHTLVDLHRGLADTTHHNSPDGKFMIRQHKPSGALTRIDTRTGAAQPLTTCLAAGEKTSWIAVDETGRALVPHGTALDLYLPGVTEPRAIAGVSGPIRQALLAPDGRGFAVLTVSGTVHAWSDPDAAPRTFDAGAKGMRGLMYAPGGDDLAAMSADRGVQVLRDGAITPVPAPGDPEQTVSMALSGDGRWLVALRMGTGTLVLHELTTGATRQLDLGLSLRAEGYHQVELAHDGAQIAVSEEERLFLVDVASGAVRKVDAGANIWSLQFEPGGDLLFGAVGDFMQAWDLRSLTPTPLWRTRGFARLAHITPDGELVTREEGEVHRFAFGLVPREPEALHAWLRERAARLGP
ncbi:Serine/threonine protein kinase [Nannocystis exedens]|uniref:Serine/threonine protein kinase n=1 Tax=Nannocystis exedens TaxID=54 RepID=A0A1I2FNT8_9BACT|nr:serine/threonine-protein kinase [Nannocystis exedens]PCC74466.1 Serine/threonine-protein kinase PK-1 [Nannocystis exedens]SFF06260.1 Serine/threonine protein kinase [Nannocystis exedens]